ncbi:MAG: hypothetical protein ACYTAQ_11995 [Planctomycetota bacterium]
MSNGDGGEYAYWLRGPDGTWRQIADFEDKIVDARFGAGGALYLLSRADAPNKRILRLPADLVDLGEAEVVVPQTDAVIRSYLPAAGSLHVVEMQGGPTRLRIYDLARSRAWSVWTMAKSCSSARATGRRRRSIDCVPAPRTWSRRPWRTPRRRTSATAWCAASTPSRTTARRSPSTSSCGRERSGAAQARCCCTATAATAPP